MPASRPIWEAPPDLAGTFATVTLANVESIDTLTVSAHDGNDVGIGASRPTNFLIIDGQRQRHDHRQQRQRHALSGTGDDLTTAGAQRSGAPR
jgi:hypothetical protein